MAKLKKAPKGTVRRVLRYVARYRAWMLLSLLSTLVSVSLTLWIPARIGDAIDLAVGQGCVDLDAIGRILLGLMIAIGTSAVLSWVAGVINNRVTYKIVRDIRTEAFEKMQRLPLSYLDTHPSGETVSRIISDVDLFADGLLIGFTQLFSGLITIIGALIFMLRENLLIAAAVVVLTPLSLLIARFIATRTYSMFGLQSKTRARQTAQLEQIIGEGKLVYAFGQKRRMMAEFDKTNEELSKYSLDAIFYSSLVNPTTRFINSMIYAAVALIGALLILEGRSIGGAITVGSLTALLSYVNQYTKPFNEISGIVTEFSGALVSGARVFELMDEMPEPAEADGALESPKGDVALDAVRFCYEDDKPLIENLSLCVEPGRHIAIVGPTGCGKTTLINLLMRFYDVKSGSIRVDGTDVRELTRHSLRRGYGMVLQQTWIKTATVRENIAIGRPDATEDEIIAAAKATHAHSFIKRLPKGYDTVISETQGGLSQGQKQLLCITRVMLALPPMLILDEATSSIDTRTELRIQRAFDQMTEGRTTFIVAHRLSTVRDADCILVMRDGKIVEQGTHEQLLDKGGFYKTLHESRFAH